MAMTKHEKIGIVLVGILVGIWSIFQLRTTYHARKQKGLKEREATCRLYDQEKCEELIKALKLYLKQISSVHEITPHSLMEKMGIPEYKEGVREPWENAYLNIEKGDTDGDGEDEVVLRLGSGWATESGYFFVIDRENGENLLYPLNIWGDGVDLFQLSDVTRDNSKEIIIHICGGSGGFLTRYIFRWEKGRYRDISPPQEISYQGSSEFEDIDGDTTPELVDEGSLGNASLFAECNAGPHLRKYYIYGWNGSRYVLSKEGFVEDPFFILDSFLKALAEGKNTEAYNMTFPEELLKNLEETDYTSFERFIKSFGNPFCKANSFSIADFMSCGGSLNKWSAPNNETINGERVCVAEKLGEGNFIFKVYGGRRCEKFYGYYEAYFKKIDGKWKITELRLIPDREVPVKKTEHVEKSTKWYKQLEKD